jgi:type 2 lantibiotic biosynthesis protein LanM
MKLSHFEVPSWFDAVTLLERTSLLAVGVGVREEDSIDRELARRRLDRWRSQTPFTNDEYFKRRLTTEGLTEETFARLLGESAGSLRNRFSEPPVWLQELERLCTAWAAELAHKVDRPDEYGFISPAEPMISDGVRRLRHGVDSLRSTYATVPFDPATVIGLLVGNLLPQIGRVVTRTMILELNVARVQGTLHGETAEDRYRDFIAQVKDPDRTLALLREYPVLARQVSNCVNYWVSTSLEFIIRLCGDWQDLCGTFSQDQEPGLLAEVRGGAGDTHNHGRSVMIAAFDSGFRLVYKPHSLAVNQHFGELQHWLNERGSHPALHSPKVLDRGQYGWTEFISAKPCESPEEVERFYQRLGASLALLYVLDATDFHHENLIAAGEHPVLIDLETLFHPRIGQLQSGSALRFSRRSVEESVLRIGLLPQQIWINREGEGIDVSGIGGAGGQMTPFQVVTAEKTGTDEMHITRKRMKTGTSENRASLGDVAVNPEDYAQCIVQGFTDMYLLIARLRQELLAETGPISRFADDEVRVIARPTKTYAQLLYESFHPNLLRCALDRDRFFDKLWVGVEQMPHTAALIPSEQADLQRGDIPMFVARPSSRDIWTTDGQPVADFLEQPGLAAVRENLCRLSDGDLSRQQWLIRSSLATTGAVKRQSPVERHIPKPGAALPTKPQLFDEARAVADRLVATVSRSEGYVGWMGLMAVQEKSWVVAPVGGDLYNGLPGIALFLAYLGGAASDERYVDLAKATLRTAICQADEMKTRFDQTVRRIGAFSGESGLIYVLTHLGHLWNEPSMLEQADRLADLVNEGIEQDQEFDILSGVAGYLCVLASLYQCTSSSTAMEGAKRCAEHLLKNSKKMERGVAWQTLGSVATEPLTGFSHGASGIAYALFQIAALAGEEHYQKVALEAIEYERSQFVAGKGNWRDLRNLDGSGSDESRVTTAWCHGAPGIGLSRLRSFSFMDDPANRSDFDVALDTTWRSGFTGSHCLCHGDLGNAELLLEASKLPGYGSWKDRSLELTADAFEAARARKWICSTPSGVQTPGLMLGLAGIGYGLLRLADPEIIPSALMLDPPRNCHGRFNRAGFPGVLCKRF